MRGSRQLVAVTSCLFPFRTTLFFSVSVPDAISPGPGLWKLNSAVLDEPEFVAHFKLLVLLA